ncbi:MAG: hypothetical protein GY771_10345 [bacterium]|nr:hypothetical protein [bacterium]
MKTGRILLTIILFGVIFASIVEAKLILADDDGAELVVPGVGSFEVNLLEDMTREIRFQSERGSSEKINSAKEHIEIRLICYETETGNLVFEREYGRRALYVWRAKGETVETVKLAHECEEPEIRDGTIYFGVIGDGYEHDESAFAPWGPRGKDAEYGQLAPYVHDGTGAYHWPAQLYYDPLNDEGGPVFEITATSTLVEWAEYPDTYSPDKMFDGRIATVWAEASDGDGVGEIITVEFPEVCHIETVVIFGGHGSSPELYYANNRIKKATLELSTGSTYDVVFEDDPMEILRGVKVGEDDVEWFKLTIDEVFPGAEYNDLCIAEISVDAPGGVDLGKEEGDWDGSLGK